MLSRLRTTIVALSVTAASAAANQQIFAIESGDGIPNSFGTALAVGGDHDGDGFPDLLIGASYSPDDGRFQVRSGRTGALIREITGTTGQWFEQFGKFVAHVDDADGDGVPEVLVQGYDQARFFSGATGALIRTHATVFPGDGVGDFDGDGRGDYAVASDAQTRVISGVNGNVLLSVPVLYGTYPVSVGDVDGDARPDLGLVHYIQPGVGLPNHSRISVFSGASGVEITRIDAAANQVFQELVTVADRDGDGRRDLAFAQPDEFPVHGRVVVHSSATGAELFSIANPQPTQAQAASSRSEFGSSLAEVGDIDLDGVPEIAVTVERPRGLWVFSGASGARLMAVQLAHGSSPLDSVRVAGVPDIDGDGRAELVYSDPRDANGPGSLGTVFVVRGAVDNSAGLVSCFGDGTGTACPCGNTGGAGLGCANTAGAGARLQSFGTASIAQHDLWFLAEGLPGGSTGSSTLFFGTTTVNNGLGAPNFAGIRCAGGALRRLGQHTWKGNGVASWVPNLVDPYYIAPGGTYHFQVLYRDVTSPCATANFTPLVSRTFAP